MKYLAGVESALHGTGLPYGYTITIFSSGEVLTQYHGVPRIWQIFLFAAGASAAYGTLRLLTRAEADESEAEMQLAAGDDVLRAGLIHVVAIGAAIGSVALFGMVDSWVVWAVGGLLATLVYLGTLGVEFGLRLAERS